MKCKNLEKGEVCGAEIPLLTKFCGYCGGKVQTEDDKTSKACPRCSSLVTNLQKFCAGCAWKIDPNIFVTKTIVCEGTREDGTTCGAELSPHMKFCVTCCTVQNKATDHAEGPKDTILHPVSESSVDGFVKDEQLRHDTNVSEGSSSGSSSRSQSPDIWKPPSTGSGSSPDSNNRKSSKSSDEVLVMETFSQGQQLHHGNSGALEEKADTTTTTFEEKDSGLNEKKERSERWTLNLAEDESGIDNNDQLTKKQKESTSPPYKDQQPSETVSNAMESVNSKPEEVARQYNTRSKTQTTDKDKVGQTLKEIASTSGTLDKKKTDQEDKSYNTRSSTQTKDAKPKSNQNASQTGSNPSANKSSEEDKSAGSKNTGGRKHAFAEVYFRIIVSPTLLPSSNKGDVFVHFQSSTLAGWNSREYKMNLKRNLPGDFMEYQAVVIIPKEMLVKPVYYAYYVIRNGENEIVYENIYNHASESNNRTLICTEQNRKRGSNIHSDKS